MTAAFKINPVRGFVDLQSQSKKDKIPAYDGNWENWTEITLPIVHGEQRKIKYFTETAAEIQGSMNRLGRVQKEENFSNIKISTDYSQTTL